MTSITKFKRTVHDTKPEAVEYAITEHGKTSIPVVKALIEWESCIESL